MSQFVTVDLSNYKDRTGAWVTPGRYRVQVEDAEVSKAGSGNEMITLWLRIMGGEFDGQTVLDRLVQTDNSLFRTVNFMQAIGLPTPKKRLQIDLSRFIGQTLDVDVDDGEPYLGRVKSEVRGYLRIAKEPRQDADAMDGIEEFANSSEPVPETLDLNDVQL